MKLIKLLFISLLGLMLTACGGDKGSSLPSQDGGGDVTKPTIISLQITPTNIAIPVGFTQQFTAIATMSDGTTKDITNDPSLDWTSSDVNVASLTNSNGLATGVTPGTVIITAAGAVNGVTFSASAQLEVTNAVVTSLQLTPARKSIPIGFEQQFTAIAILSDGRTLDVTRQSALNWNSSDTAIAAIENVAERKGIAQGLATGVVTITATGMANGTTFSSTAQLNVTNAVVTALQVTPTTFSMPVGFKQQFIATATLSDGKILDVTHQKALNWSSTAAAAIENSRGKKGIAKGLSVGTAIITASGTANGVQFNATAQLHITNAVLTDITVTPDTASVINGKSQQYTATGTFSDSSTKDISDSVYWHTDNTSIATIDTAGLATGVNLGTAGVSANLNDTTSNTVVLKVLRSNVVTWGGNSGGDSSSVQPELTDIVSITGGSDAFAAIKTDRTVVTWGLGSPADSSAVQARLTDVISIASTGHAFAAIKGDGSVVTWGNSAEGGDSSGIQYELTSVKSVTGSNSAFAALRNDGSVVTWGSAAGGGDSSSKQSQLTNVVDITSSLSAFAALKADGSVVTWGDSSWGGNSDAVQAQLTGITAIVGNRTAFAALKEDGTVITWGSGTGGDSSAVQDELINVKSLWSAGKKGSAFAALKYDGSVVTWGQAQNGGDSSSVTSLISSGVQAISGNFYSFAAIKDDGSVVTWGIAAEGGDSSSVQAQLTDVKEIIGTIGAFAALKRDGTVVTWGNTSYGANSSYVQTELTGVDSISATANAFAAIR
ncbi:Ig-like domain-containing protein [Aeromonas enteropelogenes]|uniref:Ig-like domain-containing protein n=1 Tax=Aeromonas enteropelogenes TaxID=29489 RepID=UPI003BA05D15